MESANVTFEDESKTASNLSYIFLQSDEDMSMNYILDDRRKGQKDTPSGLQLINSIPVPQR